MSEKDDEIKRLREEMVLRGKMTDHRKNYEQRCVKLSLFMWQTLNSVSCWGGLVQ